MAQRRTRRAAAISIRAATQWPGGQDARLRSDVFYRCGPSSLSRPIPRSPFSPTWPSIARNALQVPARIRRYRGKAQDDDTAKLYGMVATLTTISPAVRPTHGVGAGLEHDRDLHDDNGPQVPRYNGILNNTKGSVL